MKPLPFLLPLVVVLAGCVGGLGAGRGAPGAMLSPRCGAGGCGATPAAPRACESSQEYQKVKPGSEVPGILAYVPIRSCNRVLKDKYGEFSPPAYHGNSPMNFWCNWTIWAGSRKHIIIYIQSFITKESCNKNEDKILFEGVSSLVENSVVYACWKKETHVFATFAQAVHVVLLKKYLPNCRDTQFKGKYYIFQDQEDESSSKVDTISETPALKLPKQDSIFQSGWPENLRDVLGFESTRSTMAPDQTTALSAELMRGRGISMGISVGSPIELVPYEGARTPLLETKAPCGLGSEVLGGLRCCEEAQGRGAPESIIPTAAQDTWGHSLSGSGDVTVGFGYTHRLSSVLLETPLLGAWQGAEPFLQPAGVNLENSQSVLHQTLRPKDLGDLEFTIKPTHTSCLHLAEDLQSLSPGRRESKGSADTTMYRGLSTVTAEKDESHPQPSSPADGTGNSDVDGLVRGLMPSLSSPYETVDVDRSQVLPERSQRCQSSFKDLSTTQSELGTTGVQHMKLVNISSLECFGGVVGYNTDLSSTKPLDILQEQARDCPVAEKAHMSSLGVKSCNHQSDRAAQSGLAVRPLATGLEHPHTAVSTLGTETIPVLVVSCTEPVSVDFSCAAFTPEAPHPPAVEPVSSIDFSTPAALGLDPISRGGRGGISPASSGQDMASPYPPCHPSVAPELGTDESSRCLGPGIQKLGLGEVGSHQGKVSALMDSSTEGPSSASVTGPKPGMELPWPEVPVNSGSGVAPASLPGILEVRRQEHAVPVQHQGLAASNKLASASILGGFKMQKTTETLQVDAGEQRNASSSGNPAYPGPPVVSWGQTLSRGQKPQKPSDDPVSRNAQMPEEQQQKHAELGPPWAMKYFPVRSCHVVFQDASGIFYLPLHADIKANIWCNWTILAGSQKHIVIYVQGFQGSDGCGKNQDKIIFQGVSSSVETKVVYACHNRGTLIFAAQATAVHVLFLSGSGSLSQEYGHFKGQYYIFRDSETAGSSNDTIAPKEAVQEVSKKEKWRMVVTNGLLPMPRASPNPSDALPGGRIQPELVSSDDEAQHPPDLVEDVQSGADLSKLDLNECDQLQDEMELKRSSKDGSTVSRETKDDVLVELPPAGQRAECKAELSALEIAKGDVELVSALVSVALSHSVGVPSSEVPSSSVGISATSPSLDQASDSLSAVVAAAHRTQTLVLEEPLLHTSTKPSPLHPSASVTTADVLSPGDRGEELFDLISALASLENNTALKSQHLPGDMLFEVTIEIRPKEWFPHGRSEFQKELLESMKSHIQENLKLSANRVNEIKLKEIRRMSDANLLLTFWLHLKPEERNVSLLLRSHLEELLGTSIGVNKLQLISLFVEDVNECSAGVGLCGEEAECFNGVGTYLCRCKKDYEDHSPTKSGTLCIRAARPGISFLLRHADILVGAAIVAALAMLVAAGAICRVGRWGWHRKRNQSPEEPPVRAVEEPEMELHDLGECLRLDPFQLKLRARSPEWLWDVRAHSNQACQVFLEQSPSQ